MMGVKITDIKTDIKMLKLAKDPCFGKKYEKHGQCEKCWIKPSCLVCFRNKKK